MAGDRNLFVAAHRVNLALHRVNVGDRGVVEILAPDERREIGEKPPPEVEIARRRARLDHRGALPVLPERLVIGGGAGDRQGDRRRGGIGPQAKIDAKHVAVGGPLLQKARERLNDAHEQRARLDAIGNRGGARIVQHDEIDVARIVEFARAVLAERQHDEAAIRA